MLRRIDAEIKVLGLGDELRPLRAQQAMLPIVIATVIGGGGSPTSRKKP